MTAQAPVWICVPTYNEAEHVEALVTAVLGVLDRFRIDGRVLVIDDASPDGTGRIADRVARKDRRVEVLHRTAKGGIGPAYVAGFRRALDSGASLVIEMDCDFSHDPETIPELIAKADRADLVLGSRYISGGGVARWGVVRRLVSRAGCWYARTVLGMPTRDLTGGFKCFRRTVLEALPLHDVRASGYGFQVELTYRAVRMGFRVLEVPITFTERTAGRSKMSWRIALEAATLVLQLRARGGSAKRPPPIDERRHAGT